MHNQETEPSTRMEANQMNEISKYDYIDKTQRGMNEKYSRVYFFNVNCCQNINLLTVNDYKDYKF